MVNPVGEVGKFSGIMALLSCRGFYAVRQHCSRVMPFGAKWLLSRIYGQPCS